jgi:PKHD-type hydroxylase
MSNYNFLNENVNLINYYYYTNGMNDEEINKTIQLSKKYYCNNTDGNVSGDVLDLTYRKSKITWLHYNTDTRFLYDKISALAKDANNKMWNFNITNLFDSIQYTEYSYDPASNIQSHYDWHMDFGSKGLTTTRKLSCSIQLSDSDDYEGCDLEFMFQRTIRKAPRTKGTVIFFPSYITHRVTPITKGTRKSLVIWFHGPPFK